MKPWIKWALIGICLLTLGIIQFVPGEQQPRTLDPGDSAPSGDGH